MIRVASRCPARTTKPSTGETGLHLARVRVPIGLDLGGETAAEIALSIVSEVVAVMHGRSGAVLSAKPVVEPALQRS